MPPVNREFERQLVQRAQQRGMQPEEIKQVILQYRGQNGGGATPGVQTQPSAPQQAVEPQEKNPNILQQIAKPFARTAAAIPAIVSGVADLARGDVAGARDEFTRERDILGMDVRPVGIPQKEENIAFKPGATNAVKDVARFTGDVVGTGAEIGSYAAPFNIGKQVLTKGLLAGVRPAVQGGLLAGGLSSGGRALSEGENLGQVAKQTAGGALMGGAISGALPVLGNVVSPLTKRIFPWAARELQQTSLRLTPVQKQNLGGKLNDVTDFLTQNKIIGTPKARFENVTRMYEETENALQDFLNNTAAGRTVNKQQLIGELEVIADVYKFDRDSIAIKRQLDSAIQTIQQNFPDEIPVGVLNDFKRSTMAGAYNKAGDKVLDTVEHDIGDVIYKSLQEAVQDLTIGKMSLVEFNRRYGNLITARKLLKIAMSRKQAGLISKLVASIAAGFLGNAVGGPVGSAVGATVGPAVAEAVSGGAVRSGGASLLDAASRAKLPNIGRPLAPIIPQLNNRQ